MKYELRRMRKLSPGLTVNNSGGAGKGSVILMGEDAWNPAGSAGFPEELSPVAGKEGLGAFCFFSPFDDRTFPGNGYITRNVCDDAALFFHVTMNTNQSLNSRGSHIAWVDFLRILACFLVVLAHAVIRSLEVLTVPSTLNPLSSGEVWYGRACLCLP